mmetsp:Transcript_48610/g.125327  ORF Transcript_48610/g.125327 Transcript_48610/m.125327 type:complete len:246 (+) Transcript_48610:846-1583(+)
MYRVPLVGKFEVSMNSNARSWNSLERHGKRRPLSRTKRRKSVIQHQDFATRSRSGSSVQNECMLRWAQGCLGSKDSTNFQLLEGSASPNRRTLDGTSRPNTTRTLIRWLRGTRLKLASLSSRRSGPLYGNCSGGSRVHSSLLSLHMRSPQKHRSSVPQPKSTVGLVVRSRTWSRATFPVSQSCMSTGGTPEREFQNCAFMPAPRPRRASTMPGMSDDQSDDSGGPTRRCFTRRSQVPSAVEELRR